MRIRFGRPAKRTDLRPRLWCLACSCCPASAGEERHVAPEPNRWTSSPGGHECAGPAAADCRHTDLFVAACPVADFRVRNPGAVIMANIMTCSLVSFGIARYGVHWRPGCYPARPPPPAVHRFGLWSVQPYSFPSVGCVCWLAGIHPRCRLPPSKACRHIRIC